MARAIPENRLLGPEWFGDGQEDLCIDSVQWSIVTPVLLASS